MANDITALREELFATLRGLRSKEDPVQIETAKAIVDVARVIVDSARVEVDMVKATGMDASTGFIPLPDSMPSPTGTTVAAVPGGRVITHRTR